MYVCIAYGQCIVIIKPWKKYLMAVFVLTMFTTGDWNARGIKSTASSDLKACLRKGYQSGPPIQQYRCSAPGNPVRLSVSTSVHKPYKIYIAKNVNGHIIVTNWGKNAIVVVDRLGILRYSYSRKDRNFDLFQWQLILSAMSSLQIAKGARFICWIETWYSWGTSSLKEKYIDQAPCVFLIPVKWFWESVSPE